MDRANYVGPETGIFYNIVEGGTSSDVYVEASGLGINHAGVSKRLADMAKESGIYKSTSTATGNEYTENDPKAYMVISQTTY
jgi:hypothetical protein